MSKNIETYESLLEKENPTQSEQLLIDLIKEQGQDVIKIYNTADFGEYADQHILKLINQKLEENPTIEINELKLDVVDKLYWEYYEHDRMYEFEQPESFTLQTLLDEDEVHDFMVDSGVLFGEAKEFLDKLGKFIDSKYPDDTEKCAEVFLQFVEEMQGVVFLESTLTDSLDKSVDMVLKSDTTVELTHIVPEDWDGIYSYIDDNMNILLEAIETITPETPDEDKIAFIMKNFGGEYDPYGDTLNMNPERLKKSAVHDFAVRNGITLDSILDGSAKENHLFKEIKRCFNEFRANYRLTYLVTMSVEDSIKLVQKTQENHNNNQYLEFKTDKYMFIAPVSGTGLDVESDRIINHCLPLNELKVSPYIGEARPYNEVAGYQFDDICGTMDLKGQNKNTLKIVTLNNALDARKRLTDSLDIEVLNDKFKEVLHNQYGNDIDAWEEAQSKKYNYYPDENQEAVKAYNTKKQKLK